MNSHVFNIQPIHRFAGSNAAIRRPREFAYFSYDADRNLHLDESSLNYYYPPRLPADLNQGFESFQKLDDTVDEHLDALLETLVAYEKEHGTKCEADVITWRGMMTKILTAPFETTSGFEMNATYFQGSIFIEENNAYKIKQKEIQRNQPTTPGMPSQDLMAYWGYKFEAISVIPDIWDAVSREQIEERPNQVVNNKAQYCSVVRTGFGKTKLIIGGEVDAVWDCKPARKEDPINWVELKTTSELYTDRERIKYERKLLKFWAQSFLLGVPKVVIGFRDRNGILLRIEEIETHTIPTMVKKSRTASWDGNICINFTAAFLDWLKTVVNGPGVWRIRKREKSPYIEVFKIEDRGYGSILSPSFIKWRTT
ncbi:hypothetical protein VTN31DRAFT_6898 [Thermomyces dupontii]|uniref:uncharacterized protein n=1 Tax=Talaromyces thermophilus TaxID=28565 RepID=UPI00374371F0